MRRRRKQKKRLPRPHNNGKATLEIKKQQIFQQNLSSSLILQGSIVEYITTLLKGNCFISPTGEARKCNCLSSFLANNCSRQNKNKTMIKWCCWVHSKGRLSEEKRLFLIKGDRKNDVDREFNLLKQRQFSKVMWTVDELDVVLTKKQKVIHRFVEDDGRTLACLGQGL